MDFRTISLIPHASKILLKILAFRLESKAELFLGCDQYGFRRVCGTRDANAVMRVLCERNLEYNNKIYMCFVMVTLWNRADHYIFALLFLLLSSFFTSPNLSRRRLDVCHNSTHGVA